MKLTCLILAALLSFNASAELRGRPQNAERLAEHVVMLFDKLLSNFVDPNNKKRIRTEAEFTKYDAAAACAAMAAIAIDMPLLKVRIASEMSDDPAQVGVHNALDEQRERLRVLAHDFCEIKMPESELAGKPSATTVTALVKLRNEMRVVASTRFSKPDYSRLDTAYYADRALEVTSRLRLFTHAKDGARVTALSSTGSYMRMCYAMSAGILYVGVTKASRDDYKEDAGRTGMDRCDNLIEKTHQEGKAMLAEFCLSENRGVGITPGELTDALVNTLARLTAQMKTIKNTCKD